MTQFTIVTWNVNSVRLRLDQALRILDELRPDALCLQEIKCPDDQFPSAAFRKAGWPHIVTNGRKGYHGVAVIARTAIKAAPKKAWCGLDDGRHLSVEIEGMTIENFYVPAGGDEPDPEANPKFAHKLSFLDEMAAETARWRGDGARRILVGDLNVAPGEADVWSHKQLLNVVSHTPVETARLNALRETYEWSDVAREIIPEPERLYTWWSYRARDWRKSNRGRRLDHIWVSPSLREAATAHGRDGFEILDAARDWTRPSDHAPVRLSLDLRRA